MADPCETRKNACPASALCQCSLIRSDAADAGHKTTQRRRRPPVRRHTALNYFKVVGVQVMRHRRRQCKVDSIPEWWNATVQLWSG